MKTSIKTIATAIALSALFVGATSANVVIGNQGNDSDVNATNDTAISFKDSVIAPPGHYEDITNEASALRAKEAYEIFDRSR